jgi:nicotinate-nucleotide adenylyltransferase
MLLGIFGGSFDPVHNGHLALARACHDQATLDEVWFLPTAIQPLKQRGPHASDAQRIEMLRLALQSALREPGRGYPRQSDSWRVCTLEIDRGGYSYTVDTLRQLHTELPEAQLFFMIGADAIRDVPQWKEPAEIFRLATPLVVQRAGQPEPNLASIVPLCSMHTQPKLIEMPLVDVSSSEIRRRIASDETIDGMLPPAVAQFIMQNGLYR